MSAHRCSHCSWSSPSLLDRQETSVREIRHDRAHPAGDLNPELSTRVLSLRFLSPTSQETRDSNTGPGGGRVLFCFAFPHNEQTPFDFRFLSRARWSVSLLHVLVLSDPPY